jgi:hypothetical protein
MRIQDNIYKLPTKRRHNQPRLAAAKHGLLPWARAIQLIYLGRPKQEIFK